MKTVNFLIWVTLLICAALITQTESRPQTKLENQVYVHDITSLSKEDAGGGRGISEDSFQKLLAKNKSLRKQFMVKLRKKPK